MRERRDIEQPTAHWPVPPFRTLLVAYAAVLGNFLLPLSHLSKNWINQLHKVVNIPESDRKPKVWQTCKGDT